MNPQRWLAFWWMLFGYAVLAVAQVPAHHTSTQFRIAGYLPDYRTFDATQANSLTDLIIFSAQPTESGDLDLSRLAKTDWAQLLAAKRKHKLRIILCVGGWERSTHFAKVAASEKLRANFANAARQICIDKQLDGIDLDWEHPRDAAEQNSYAVLLQDLKHVLHPAGRSVSITMAAWQALPRSAFAAVDWIQVMAYDHPGRHSTFENAQADVNKLIEAGAPPHKIMLGLPFYGRTIEKADRTLTYREIVDKYGTAPTADEVDGIYFNGPSMIERKTRYALDAKLAGVMIWELGQDASVQASLLQAIARACHEPRYRISVQRAEDRVECQTVERRPVLVVTSPTGIGSAVIYRPASGWPKETNMILKMKLKGLEQLRVSVGDLNWMVAVSSSDHKPTIRLQRGKRETEVANSQDRYWTDVKTDSGFELELPNTFFTDNPESITIHWIDFFR